MRRKAESGDCCPKVSEKLLKDKRLLIHAVEKGIATGFRGARLLGRLAKSETEEIRDHGVL